MKLRKMGQAVLAAAASAGFLLGMTSCSNDHTVGYVYVTGTQYNQVGAYREDNNEGVLRAIQGQPFGSGGTNPTRIVIPSNSRFAYVLNAGTRTVASDGSVSYTGENISVFSIGGYGQLTFQHAYDTQGIGPQRISIDSAGTHLFVLDEYSPIGNSGGSIQTVSTTQTANFPCEESANVYRPAGDVTVFNIDPATGRLTLVSNQQQQNLTYFPVGCFPTDFRVLGSFLYTMDAGATSNNDVQTIFVYAASTSTGQLTLTQTAPIPTGATRVSSIGSSSSGNFLYLLDAGADYILPYVVGTSGSLTAVNSGATNNALYDGGVGNPQQMITVAGGSNQYLYVANAGPAGGTTAANSDVSGYLINPSTGQLTQAATDSPYGLNTVSGAVCIFEDPSNQYIYVAGANDNTIAGKKYDPQIGTLRDLNNATSFTTVGTPSWCVGTTSSR